MSIEATFLSESKMLNQQAVNELDGGYRTPVALKTQRDKELAEFMQSVRVL
jgi:hypothetical protein